MSILTDVRDLIARQTLTRVQLCVMHESAARAAMPYPAWHVPLTIAGCPVASAESWECVLCRAQEGLL